MAVDSPGNRCRWVRDRLPLLAGGELTGADRRKAERHLIACPSCRERERSMASALGALQAAATVGPVGLDLDLDRAEAPSLWPALARQIRESRHEREPASWLDNAARLLLNRSSAPRFRPIWTLAGALLLVAIITAGVNAWSRSRVVEFSSSPYVFEAPEPSLPEDDFGLDLPLPPAPVALLPSPAPQPPLPGRDLVRDDAPVAPAVDRTASRFDYDLDHGTPMGPDGVDVKASY